MAKKKTFGIKPIKAPKDASGKMKKAKPLGKPITPKKPKKAPAWMSPPSVKNNPAAENSGPIPMNVLPKPKKMK